MTARTAIHLLTAALAASLLAGCATPSGNPTDPPALPGKSIIDRPNRLAEEHAAWNPKPILMEEFLHPAIPLKDKYPTLEISPRVAGVVFWMDNRYAMVWAGGSKEKTTGRATPYIAILDTDTGEIYDYKPGWLICYRNNHLTFESADRDENHLKRWSGTLGQEIEVPISYKEQTDKGETTFKYWVDELDCENKRRDTNLRKTEALFGSYVPKVLGDFQRPGESYTRRSYWPLLPQHGFLSVDLEKSSAIPWAEHKRFVGITWFKPNSESQELDLGPWSEVGWPIEAKYWSPFLGRYVFQGGVMFNNLPHAGRGRPPSDWIYLAEDRQTSTVAFSPLDGSIVKMRRPRYLLENVDTRAVYATRAGLLWVAAPVGQQRGYHLSQGETVKRIFDYEVHPVNTWVSPDGCKVMSYYDPSASSGPSRMTGALGAIFDFSSAGSGRKHMAIINLCKSE